jgi:hypothetical protein
MALGRARKKALESMQEKSTLQPIESPESLEDLKEAVKAVSLEDYM